MEAYRNQIVTHAADHVGLSRRHVLRTLGLAAGGMGLLGTHPALAQNLPVREPAIIEILQFSLALEHLEASLYEQAIPFLESQSDAAFAALAVQNPKARVIEITTITRKNEQTHEQALTSAITCAGATPVPRCEYNFAPVFQTVTTFLQAARMSEETGVMAYLGGVPILAFEAPILVEVSKIVTMEARHATLWRRLLREADPLSGTGAMPTCNAAFGSGAFDRLATMDEVRARVAPLIASASCPPLKP